jgi:carbon storage regulator
MLVLSRQRDETIMIGDDIEITIVDIRGDKVRLGITAPATIPVHRKEVYDAIQRENREASRVKMEDLGGLPRAAGRSSVPPGLHRPARPPSAGQGEGPPNGAASSNGTAPSTAPSPPQINPGSSAGSVPA